MRTRFLPEEHRQWWRLALSFIIYHLSFSPAGAQHLPTGAQQLTFVELNCENLFDTRHDEGKEDYEFTPEGARHWTGPKYWRKLNGIGQELLACDTRLPDLVALCEVENDTVLHDLTHRSLLRNAGYHYVMTESPDVRGIDVALLYQPYTFRLLCYDYITVPPVKDMRPTRDILYVEGETAQGDTLHLFVYHAPSRYGGERTTRPHRMQAMHMLLQAIAQLPARASIIVAGDFNDYADSPALATLADRGLTNVTAQARGQHGRASGTYRYQGEWHSLDHVLVSPALLPRIVSATICDAPFLLEKDTQYGGYHPRRTFNGYHYQRGFSDHLPLVVRLQ